MAEEPEPPPRWQISRYKGDFVLFEDVERYLDDVTPPQSARVLGTFNEQATAVTSGGGDVFIRVEWLERHAPHAALGQFYQEATTLPCSVRQLRGLPTDLFSVGRDRALERRQDASSSSSNPYDRAKAMATRKKEAKDLRTTVVKCCLKKRIRDSVLLDKIKGLVEYMSKVTHRTGLVLNWIALDVLNADPVRVALTVRDDDSVGFNITVNPTPTLPDFTDQSFIDRVMAIDRVLDTAPDDRDPYVLRAFEQLFHTFPAIPFIPSVSTPASQTTRQNVIANLKTYFGYTYTQHQKRFLKGWCSVNCPDAEKGLWWRLQKAINKWERAVDVDADDEELEAAAERAANAAPLPAVALALIRSERSLLGLEADDTRSTSVFRKENVHFVIVAYHRWTSFLQRHDFKSFTVLPLGRIRAKHVDIDTKTLFGMLYSARTGATRDEAVAAFFELKTDHWHSVFRLDGLRNTFDFAHMVTTDGVSASFHFQRPYTVTEKETNKERSAQGKRDAANAKQREKRLLKKLQKEGVEIPPTQSPFTKLLAEGHVKRIIGVDPGRTNIMVTVELVNEKIVTHRLTRAQYKVMTGMKKLNAVSNGRTRRVHAAQQQLDQVSLKTTSANVIAEHVHRLSWVNTDGDSHSTLYDFLWDEKLRPCHARDRFGVWSRKNKVLDWFFDKVSGGDPDVLWAYGDASFAPASKGSDSVPVKSASRRCVTKHGVENVASIPEFRTTIACCGCHRRLHDVKRRISEGEYEEALRKARIKSEETGKPLRSPRRTVSVRGLKRCSNTACDKFGLCDRDINAAYNIRTCGAEARPPSLERESGLSGSVKAIFLRKRAEKRVVSRGTSTEGGSGKPMHCNTRLFGPI
jgi:hypothetical protein